MDAAKLVEIGMKLIVLLLAAGWFLCFIAFLYGSIKESIAWIKTDEDGKKRRESRNLAIIFFILSIVSAILSTVHSGLIIMRWLS